MKPAGTACWASASAGLLRVYSVTSTQRPADTGLGLAEAVLRRRRPPPPNRPPSAAHRVAAGTAMPPIGMPMPLKVATSIQACAWGGLTLAVWAGAAPASSDSASQRGEPQRGGGVMITPKSTCGGAFCRRPLRGACGGARNLHLRRTRCAGRAAAPTHASPPCADRPSTTCAAMRWRAAVRPDHAAQGHRAAGLRAGRPDPRAGARAGPDAAPPRRATTAPATWSGATRGSPIEEDFFVNYGFLPRATQALMHPRTPRTRVAEGALGAGRRRCWTSCASAAWCTRARSTRSFAHGKAQQLVRRLAATPARSCSTACTTAACCAWRGARAACACTRRARRTPPARPTRRAALDALVDVVVAKYAPLPARDARRTGRPPARRRRRSGRGDRARALARAKARLPQAAVDGVDWYWPAGENPASRRHAPDDARAPARALRPRRLGPPPLRAAVGLGLPLRGLHAGAEARARLLRAAAAVARPGHRLGQPGRSPTAGSRPTLGYVAGKPPREAALSAGAGGGARSACGSFLAPR